MRPLAVLVLAAALAGGALAAARPRLDLRSDGGRPAAFLRYFHAGELRAAAAPDEIRAIDRPLFDTPSQAKALLPPSSLVIGLERGGQSHAYPIDLLSLHEVVNDLVGGEPVAVTWCPLCSTALGFDRRVGDRVLAFGVSGYLYRANQILFDRQTGSLWSQLLGGAVTGRYRGTTLRPVTVVEETWAAWLAQHPRTVVLSVRRDSLASRFTRPHSTVTSAGIEESDSPYGAYASKVSTYYPRVVRGVPDSELVLGVVVDGRAKAYPQIVLERRRALGDVLAGRPLLVAYDPAALTGGVFSRRLRGRTLSFRLEQGRLVDRETGSRWSPATGRAVAGPLAGAQLPRLPATFAYWFAWRGFYPDTALVPR